MRNDFGHVYTDGHNGPRFPDHHLKRRHIRDEDGDVIRGGRSYREARRGWRESNNVHYSLIQRFLASRIGRRWDEVLSEASTVLRGDSLAHDILSDFRRWRVDRHCVRVDGELHDPRGFLVRGFHVDPDDGTLRYVGDDYRRYSWATRRRLEAYLDGDRLTLNEPGADLKAAYERVEGCWFHHVWKDIPAYASGREVYRLMAENRKRQISGKEVARLRLEEWRSLAGALDDSIDGRSWDEVVHRRMKEIRKAAMRKAKASS